MGLQSGKGDVEKSDDYGDSYWLRNGGMVQKWYPSYNRCKESYGTGTTWVLDILLVAHAAPKWLKTPKLPTIVWSQEQRGTKGRELDFVHRLLFSLSFSLGFLLDNSFWGCLLSDQRWCPCYALAEDIKCNIVLLRWFHPLTTLYDSNHVMPQVVCTAVRYFVLLPPPSSSRFSYSGLAFPMRIISDFIIFCFSRVAFPSQSNFLS